MKSSNEPTTQEVMGELLRDILTELNARSAEYLVVGGYAIQSRVPVRAPRDIDLWVRPELGNLVRVGEASLRFVPEGSKYDLPYDLQTSPDGSVFWTHPRTGIVVNYRTSLPGDTEIGGFERAWSQRFVREFQGVRAHYPSPGHLVVLSLAAAAHAWTNEMRWKHHDNARALVAAEAWIESLLTRSYLIATGEFTPTPRSSSLTPDQRALVARFWKERAQELAREEHTKPEDRDRHL